MEACPFDNQGLNDKMDDRRFTNMCKKSLWSEMPASGPEKCGNSWVWSRTTILDENFRATILLWCACVRVRMGVHVLSAFVCVYMCGAHERISLSRTSDSDFFLMFVCMPVHMDVYICVHVCAFLNKQHLPVVSSGTRDHSDSMMMSGLNHGVAQLGASSELVSAVAGHNGEICTSTWYVCTYVWI
jgi:hypothetical protein